MPHFKTLHRALVFYFSLQICSLDLSAQKEYEFPLLSPSNEYDSLMHGELVKDPYRFLEDPSDSRTVNWLADEEKLFKKYNRSLVRTNELQNQLSNLYRIKNREYGSWVSDLEDLDESNFEFALRAESLNRTRDLYYKEKDQSNYVKLFRANDFKRTSGDNVIIKGYEIDDSDQFLAVSISHGGEDWREIIIIDLKTRQPLPDRIINTRTSSVVWAQGGFFYTGYANAEGNFETRKFASLRFHKINSLQENDVVLYHNPDTTNKHWFSFSLIDDNLLYVQHPQKLKSQWIDVSSIGNFENGIENFRLESFFYQAKSSAYKISPQLVFGDSVICLANINSPNGKVVILDKSESNKLLPMVPEFDEPLVDINRLGENHISCFYRKNGASTVAIFSLAGEMVKRFTFPVGTDVSGFYASEDRNESFYWLDSFLHPPVLYRLDLESFVSSRLSEITLPYNSDDFEVTYTRYPSKGVNVPMYIMSAKGIKKNRKNPTLIYAYGGYGTTIEPEYRPDYLLWLLNGGVIAIPSVRGGGADGSEWALAGRGVNKGNSVEDLAAAAAFLDDQNYTQPKLTAVTGTGFLVGAAMTHRPELFNTAVIEAGALDMLRFHRFTVGGAYSNIKEFGDPSNPNEFKVLKEFSPYHNVSENSVYPNTLFIVGDKDDRVPAFHTYKMLANLQNLSKEGGFHLMKLNEGAGHSLFSTSLQYYESMSAKYLFLMDQMNMNLRVW